MTFHNTFKLGLVHLAESVMLIVVSCFCFVPLFLFNPVHVITPE